MGFKLFEGGLIMLRLVELRLFMVGCIGGC